VNAARRSRRKQDWPRGLYEPRPGYFVWRHPKTGETMAIGRTTVADARNQALAANQHVLDTAPTLIERMEGREHTVADVLDVMPEAENANTAKSQRSLDKRIRAKLGGKHCGRLSVRDCADMLDEIVEDGHARTAQAVRSRLIVVCKKALAKGWMESNPAEVTEEIEVEVKRGRLTLEMFHAVYENAPEVCEWLQAAMRLALVTGQDRSTICDMERSHVADGFLTVWRTKTRETNQPVDIPLALRLDAVGWSLADLVKPRTGVLSKYLVHHVQPWGNAPAGSPIHVNALSRSFTEARILAKIPDVGPDGKGAPTFHEIRSLSKRLYAAQGGVDTKALLGHKTDKAADLYADPRGVEHIRVRIA
jgi:integrase